MNIKTLIAKGESETLEFKKSIGESKEIIKTISAFSNDHLTLAFGRPYKRVGKSTVKMSKDEYERLILKKHKGKLYFDSQICQNASLKEIGRKRVEWFVKEARRQRGLDIDESLSTGEILERLKFIKDKRLTNAAVLLFSKNPQQLFLQTVIKAIRFKGTDVTEDMLDFKTIEGDFLNQLKKAEDFIFEHKKN